MSKKIKTYGFTLIELLVVIAIIGVLASIVLVSLSSARARGNATRAKADLSQVMSAMEMFANDNTVSNIGVDDIVAGAADGEVKAGRDKLVGTNCVASADEFDNTPAASNLPTTSGPIFANFLANSDLCYTMVFKSDAANAIVKDTVYLSLLPTPPAGFAYELATAGATNSYALIARGFSDTAAAGGFACSDGVCVCYNDYSTAAIDNSKCQR